MKATAITRSRTGGLSLRIPFTVEGVEGFVEVGIQVTKMTTEPLKTLGGPDKLQGAVNKALAEPILVKYPKGLVEDMMLSDAIVDVLVAKAREGV